MKIFPPLSEMLWPKGWSFFQVVASWRTAPFALLGVAGGVAIWTITDQPFGRAAGVSGANLIVSGSCSSLSRNLVDRDTTAGACDPRRHAAGQLEAGASITAGRALQRAAMPPREGQLTAADHAIQAPKTETKSQNMPEPDTRPAIRTSVFDEAITPAQLMPDYAPKQPALALSPTQQ